MIKVPSAELHPEQPKVKPCDTAEIIFRVSYILPVNPEKRDAFVHVHK